MVLVIIAALILAAVACSANRHGTATPKGALDEAPPDRPMKTKSADEVVWVGAAREEATPDRDLIMGGYGVAFFSRACARWSKGVHDPLYATALYLAKGDVEVVVIHVDAVGLIWTDQWAIRREVARRVGIPISRVITAASHTHHGPDTIGLWGPVIPSASGRDEHYINALVRVAADAGVEAYLARKPAVLAYAKGEVAELHRNTYDDQIPDPYIDHTLTVLVAREAADGAPILTLANWGCHPTSQGAQNRLISADWVGGYYAHLAERGLGLPMFVNASIGASIQPDGAWFRRDYPNLDPESFTYTDTMGARFAGAVADLAAAAEPLTFDRIGVDERLVRTTMDNALYQLATKQGLMPPGLPELDGEYRSRVTSVTLGPLRIGTMPGEMSPQLGMKIREALGGDAQMLFGLSQDYVGYILDRDQYDDPMYQYEHMLCIGPAFGEAVVSAHYEMRVSAENAAAKSVTD